MEESGALTGPGYFHHEPHYIHDKMIDAFPDNNWNHIHDNVLENCYSHH
jgi:hypothetical protein